MRIDETWHDDHIGGIDDLRAICSEIRADRGDLTVFDQDIALHEIANLGMKPVRWIETQAPLPPAKEVFRFERDWTQYDVNQPASSPTRMGS